MLFGLQSSVAPELADSLGFHYMPEFKMDDILIDNYGNDLRNFYHLVSAISRAKFSTRCFSVSEMHADSRLVRLMNKKHLMAKRRKSCLKLNKKQAMLFGVT